ncbi:MAG: universal stress protein [Thermoplasmata archaeon]|nr:universal stress protein [Thermoplasmata archaeon]
MNGDMGRILRILAPTSGSYAAERNAPMIMRIAKRLGAEVVAVHIRVKGQDREGDMPLQIFAREAEREGVKCTLIPAEGEVAPTIISLARFHRADIILMGATEGSFVASWILDEIAKKTSIPVLLLPFSD